MDGILVISPTQFGSTVCRAALAAMVLACGAQSATQAQSIDVSLNLSYANVADPESGGTWELAVKTDEFGLSGISILLQDISNPLDSTVVTPNATVNNGDFAGMFGEIATLSDYVIFAAGHEAPSETGDQTRFYGIGSINDPEGGSPNYPGQTPDTTSIGPELTTLSSPENLPWGTGDFLDDAAWTQAAVLFTGTFAPGQTPSFYSENTITTQGIVFTSLPATAMEVGTQSDFFDATTVVRSDLGLQTPGDFNGDGIVNLADYTLWRDRFGSTVSPVGTGADGNGDGLVDASDYAVWKTNFGNTAGSLVAGAITGNPIPEPQSVALAMFATFIVGLTGRRISAPGEAH